MIEFETKIRVRYAETDKMGFVYYGNYAAYFEVARVEGLRSLGITYKELEDNHIMLPVVSFDIKYEKPAFYDDLLTVKTKLVEYGSVKLDFNYTCYNENSIKLNEANTTLVFMDSLTKKVTKPPSVFIDAIKGY